MAQLSKMSFYSSATHMRAVVGSIALHALIAAWLLSTIVPAEIMPQQMIKVTMIAAPAAEIVEQQSEIDPLENIQQKMAESVPIPSPPKESNHAISKPETAQAKTLSPQALASLNPSAGNNAAAQASPQLVTTKPLFDAAYLNNPVPEYPTLAKRRGMEGTVMLHVFVSRDGLAQSVRIAETSGFSPLDESAKDAVSRWKFVPARKGNEAVEASVMVPIEFKMD